MPWFPRGAIHLAVVDPGVGTARRALCAVDPEGRRFVAPGQRAPHAVPRPGRARLRPRARRRARRRRAARPSTGATSSPRPRSSSRAARIPSALGPAVDDPVLLPWPHAEAPRGGEVRGETLAADPFGNLVTSIRDADLAGAPVARAEVDGRPARWVRTFGEGRPGELLALVGSGGRVELAVREGSAAALLGRVRGSAVRVVAGWPRGERLLEFRPMSATTTSGARAPPPRDPGRVPERRQLPLATGRPTSARAASSSTPASRCRSGTDGPHPRAAPGRVVPVPAQRARHARHRVRQPRQHGARAWGSSSPTWTSRSGARSRRSSSGCATTSRGVAWPSSRRPLRTPR